LFYYILLFLFKYFFINKVKDETAYQVRYNYGQRYTEFGEDVEDARESIGVLDYHLIRYAASLLTVGHPNKTGVADIKALLIPAAEVL